MSAIFSKCRKYRYRLERTVASDGPVYAFFGINPSTADATYNDQTVSKWIGFVKEWGGSRFIVGNVFSYRSSDVSKLAADPAHIKPDHLAHLRGIVADADILVPCWGSRDKVLNVLHPSIDELAAMLRASGKPTMCLGLTKSGDPKHVLKLGYSTPLEPWGVPDAPDRAPAP